MTSPVDTTVKIFHSDMVGAPVLTGAAGSLIALLDACLVNGFGAKTLTSLTVSAGVATCAFSGTHPAMVDSVVLIAGATPATLNGEQKVTAVGTGTVSFATAENNITASGTITMKLAPAGWEKRFTGTNLAVYRSLDVSSNRFNFRVNDLASNARVVGYETMTAVSTGTNPFPTAVQASGGLYWNKAYDTDITSAIPWMVFANGKRFLFCNAPFAVASYAVAYTSMFILGFGDFTSYKSTVDSYACCIAGQVNVGTPGYSGFGMTNGAQAYFARSHTGTVGAVQGELVAGFQGAASVGSGESAVCGELPGVTGKLILTQPALANGFGANGLRGVMKELYHTPQGILQSVNLRKLDIVNGVGLALGRKLMVVHSSSGGSDPTASPYIPCTFIDVTGPWE